MPRQPVAPRLLEGVVLVLVGSDGVDNVIGDVVLPIDGEVVVVHVRLGCIIPAAATLMVQAFPSSGTDSGCCPIDAGEVMAPPVATLIAKCQANTHRNMSTHVRFVPPAMQVAWPPTSWYRSDCGMMRSALGLFGLEAG